MYNRTEYIQIGTAYESGLACGVMGTAYLGPLWKPLQGHHGSKWCLQQPPVTTYTEYPSPTYNIIWLCGT